MAGWPIHEGWRVWCRRRDRCGRDRSIAWRLSVRCARAVGWGWLTWPFDRRDDWRRCFALRVAPDQEGLAAQGGCRRGKLPAAVAHAKARATVQPVAV